MRVISGSAKGTKLISPIGDTARPTADRIKESLFNIISKDIYGASFLDLFSGSGAIGIEALSRGASFVHFIEIDKGNIDTINKNIKKTKVDDRSIVCHSDVIKGIHNLTKNNKSFDIIFLDPPYLKDILNKTIIEIDKANILKKEGYIICEMHIDDKEFSTDNFYIERIKKYKITKIAFFKHKN